jgi:hypothetical protein
MDSYQKQTYDAPHNSRKKTNGNNRHNHRSVTKDWLTSIGCNLMQYLTPATIRYIPLDDLETKISAQIKQAIHLDNVTLHQQYKYQTGKRGTETSIKNQ